MVEKANPSVNRPASAFETSGAIGHGGYATLSDPGYVVQASSPTEMSIQDGDLTESNYNAFAETHSASSYDVTIDAGEAFVFGSWLAIDVSTTVTLSASTTNQMVYVGWNKDGANDVIIGTASDFASASGDADQKIPIWEFDTDGSGVTAARDQRGIGYSVNIEDTAYFGPNEEMEVSYDTTNGKLAVTNNNGNEVISFGDSGAGTTLEAGDLVDAEGNLIYDQSANNIPLAILEASTVTVTAGTGLNGGGSASLGGSTTLSVNDSRYVNTGGDTITGQLNMSAELNINQTSGRLVLPVGTDKYAT